MESFHPSMVGMVNGALILACRELLFQCIFLALCLVGLIPGEESEAMKAMKGNVKLAGT